MPPMMYPMMQPPSLAQINSQVQYLQLTNNLRIQQQISNYLTDYERRIQQYQAPADPKILFDLAAASNAANYQQLNRMM